MSANPQKRLREEDDVSHLQHPQKRAREDESPKEIPRPRKRPGGASRISRSEADAVARRQQQRAAEASAAASIRGNEEIVRQHYNAVPERGREWRKTDSRIKGLRSFNNWVKSTIIHKFSPNEEGREEDLLKVLDIGCGKGGDLGKWAQAPQSVGYYVGIDPAEISVDQARDRYMQMRPDGSGGSSRGRGGRGGHQGVRNKRIFDAAFLIDDAFANSLGDLPIIRQIGFGPGSRWGPSGGFDVVSMMFCMHYAFETEAKAKGMLANVANSLRKGGRLLGVIPNSDVIRNHVVDFHERQKKKVTAPTDADQDKNEASINGVAHSDLDKVNTVTEADAPPALNNITEPAPDMPPPTNGIITSPLSTSNPSNPPLPPSNHENPSTVEWGNSIYRVRFPSTTPPDGIFRPPYGWKYSYFMEEAVEEVPEYVVPWEAFRAIAEDYNLELQYRKPFVEIWEEEGSSPIFGPLSERMGVREKDGGGLRVSEEEMEAAGFYHAFCFYKI